MGLFGGSKSKSTTNIDENNLTSVDNRLVEADTANVGGNVSVGEAGSNLNITTTDFGALDAASELARESLNYGETVTRNSVDAVRIMAGDAGASINSALSKVTKFATSQQPDQKASSTLQLLIISVAIVGAVALYRRGK
jgi:hypothetical protein